MSNTAKVNTLLERNDLSESDLIQEINSTINHLDVHDQIDIHGTLSPKAINRIYPLLYNITIHSHAKEHITWAYFKQQITGVDSLSNELVQEMVRVYEEHKYLAVESLFVEALKKDVLSLTQLDIAEKIFSGKAFHKESEAFKCREIVRSGNSLNAKEVSMLVELRAFTTLDYALDKNSITEEGLRQITEPASSENDRKIKLALFHKANSY